MRRALKGNLLRSLPLPLWLIIIAAGCGQTDLYSNLPEKEANEMMAILMEHGISCRKQAGDENAWNLTVDPNRFAEAVEILSELGRPRETFATIGELFPKTGLVSSPAEQRIRLTYGLEQSLAKTVTELPQVVSARVHLVLPDNNPFGESLQPSSASVVVIHRRNAEMETSVPLIKQIVIGGVAELKVDAVSVELVEAEESMFGRRGARRADQPAPEVSEILFVSVAKESAGRFLAIVVAAAATFVLGLLLILVSVLRRGARAKQAV